MDSVRSIEVELTSLSLQNAFCSLPAQKSILTEHLHSFATILGQSLDKRKIEELAEKVSLAIIQSTEKQAKSSDQEA